MRIWLVALLLGLALNPARALDYGMTREQVARELGRPSTEVRRGAREILNYPNNVRIELEGGKVTVIRGLEVVDGAFVVPGAALPAAPSVPAQKTDETAMEAEPEAKPVAEVPAELEAVEKLEANAQKRYDETNTKGLAEMEKAIDQLETLHEQQSEPLPAPVFSGAAFLVELVVKWVLMLAALKLACKFWGYDTFWSSLLIAAAADTAVRVTVDLIGHHVLGMMSLFYADEAIAAIALVLVLKKVSINQSTAFAVQITLTSKVFSIVVGAFLVTVLLNLLN